MAGFAQKSGSQEETEAYVVELRELFTQRNVPFGRPEDLPGFVDALARDAALADEMRSMLRAILFREEQQIGRMELLELLALSVGGPPAENTTPATQASVRELFTFVNQAMRMPAFGDWEAPSEPASLRPDTPLTASDILATTAPDLSLPAPPAPASQSAPAPQTEPAPEPPASPGPHERYALRGATEKETRAADAVPAASGEPGQDMEEAEEAQPAGRRSWQLPAFVVSLLVATGVGFTLGRHAPTPPQAGLQSLGNASGIVQKPMRLEVCVRPPQKGVTHSSLNAQMQEAHQLMDGTLYAQALPLLLDVAQLDPGYPGVGLDVSQTLLRLHRLEPARQAVDLEINQTECLSRLPKEELDRYCTAQYVEGSQSSCRPQLAHQRQAAQMQAALVHIEMGHAVADTGEAAALRELTHEANGDANAGKTARPTQSPAQ